MSIANTERQGKILAGNIFARIKEEPTRPLTFVPLGALSTIGHTEMVAEILSLKISEVFVFCSGRRHTY